MDRILCNHNPDRIAASYAVPVLSGIGKRALGLSDNGT
jgi:hypothetical protein